MDLDDFSFDLPPDRIALRPAPRRDGSRLMVLSGDGFEHRRFSDLPEYLRQGDILLLNDTRVLPVRLAGSKTTGGRLDVLLLRPVEGNGAGCPVWEVLYRGRYEGRLKINDELEMELFFTAGTGQKMARFFFRGDLLEIISRCGAMPLPPYIKRKPDESDRERYQTVYCREAGGRDSGVSGSIAAPTAGLHFTGELLDAIRAKGVRVRFLTLHVGRGTFMPVKSRDVREHLMEREHFEISRALVDEIDEARRAGGRLFAVGTTTTRAIEGFYSGRFRPEERKTMEDGAISGSISGSTGIFIYPGYRFRAVDALVTNFHLPRSTPLMLASAMAGRLALLKAYEGAVLAGYRFFSYGDAMLIFDGKKCF